MGAGISACDIITDERKTAASIFIWPKLTFLIWFDAHGPVRVFFVIFSLPHSFASLFPIRARFSLAKRALCSELCLSNKTLDKAPLPEDVRNPHEKYSCAKSRDHIDVLLFSCFVRKYGGSRILDEFQAHVVGWLAILRLGTCQPDEIFLR